MLMQLCEETEIHWTVYFQWTNYMVYKLCLNIAVKIKTNKQNHVFLLFKSSSEASPGDLTNLSTFILHFHLHLRPRHLHLGSPVPAVASWQALWSTLTLSHTGKNGLLSINQNISFFCLKPPTVSHFTWNKIWITSLAWSLKGAAVGSSVSSPRPCSLLSSPHMCLACAAQSLCPHGFFCLILALQTGPGSDISSDRVPAHLSCAAAPPLSEIPSAPSAISSFPLSVYCFLFSPEAVPWGQRFLLALFSPVPPVSKTVPGECSLMGQMNRTLPGPPVSPRMKYQFFLNISPILHYFYFLN